MVLTLVIEGHDGVLRPPTSPLLFLIPTSFLLTSRRPVSGRKQQAHIPPLPSRIFIAQVSVRSPRRMESYAQSITCRPPWVRASMTASPVRNSVCTMWPSITPSASSPNTGLVRIWQKLTSRVHFAPARFVARTGLSSASSGTGNTILSGFSPLAYVRARLFSTPWPTRWNGFSKTSSVFRPSCTTWTTIWMCARTRSPWQRNSWISSCQSFAT